MMPGPIDGRTAFAKIARHSQLRIHLDLKCAVGLRLEGAQDERQRLARDIHDTLAQGFTSVIKHLEAKLRRRFDRAEAGCIFCPRRTSGDRLYPDSSTPITIRACC